ncbi:MAG: M12 family metallo-peptidase, partial [Cryomorphaceae bacterium]|nr:M12 family metallo-peptidase [Cryomorphaceae bacterium]
MKSSILIVLVFILSIGGIHAQKTKVIDLPVEPIANATDVPSGFVQIQATAFKLVKMNVSTLLNQLQGITYREGAMDGFVGELTLPYPDGSNHSFTVKRNQTLHPDLNVKFSETMTLDGYALDGSGAFAKWDITPQGFHAMIMIPGKSTVFIDPYLKGNTEYYIVYEKDAFITDKQKECGVVSASKGQPGPTVKLAFGTCELRTYRLALSATGEYTAFHGGTVALAQAAQATSMNRVNGVYEKDIAITMVIVPNNNLIVYTSTTGDPFTNGTPGTMINQNQTTCDGQIGSANYDIGHVFGTNSGGLAGLGVVCTGGQKARGVTGSSAPIGDPFDIDYVAHEMGHQFGGNHTQNNNCNSVGAARREPGSASTIMGYAGICAPNVQNNSDDYFHGYNLGEISAEILSGGHTCEVITALNNSAPTITSAGGNISVPINTPFVLTGVATDPNNDVLTYLWEQMDNEASTQPPVATATGGPNFRSFDPSTNPSRYFPNLASLAANGPYTWEVLPSVSRVMDFRLTVKDN